MPIWPAPRTGIRNRQYWSGKSILPHRPETGPPTYAELIQRTGSDGESVVVLEGATYVWRDAISFWLRQEFDDAANGNLAVAGRIDGDVVPESETPDVWTDSAQVSVDNGYVKYNGVGTFARSELTWPAVNSRWSLEGRAILDDVPTQDAANTTEWRLRNWLKRVELTLWEFDSGFARLTTGFGQTPVGTIHRDLSFEGEEHHFAIGYDGTDVKVWFDHEASPSLEAAFASFPNDGGSIFSIGQWAGDASPNFDYVLRVRNLLTYRLT